MIGVVYAVSSAGAVLLADRSPHGAEHLRGMLVGSLLACGPLEVLKVAAALRADRALALALPPARSSSSRPIPTRAYREGWRVRAWDFLFYASFGVVVTSSVRIAGVLLVFSYLIVPALAGILLARRIGRRLAVGWAFGAAVSVARHARLRGARPADRRHRGLRLRPEPPGPGALVLRVRRLA